MNSLTHGPPHRAPHPKIASTHGVAIADRDRDNYLLTFRTRPHLGIGESSTYPQREHDGRRTYPQPKTALIHSVSTKAGPPWRY